MATLADCTFAGRHDINDILGRTICSSTAWTVNTEATKQKNYTD